MQTVNRNIFLVRVIQEKRVGSINSEPVFQLCGFAVKQAFLVHFVRHHAVFELEEVSWL